MAEDCVKFVDKDVEAPTIQVIPKSKPSPQKPSSTTTTESLSSLNSAAFNGVALPPPTGRDPFCQSSPLRPRSIEESSFAAMTTTPLGSSSASLFAKGSNNTVNTIGGGGANSINSQPQQNINICNTGFSSLADHQSPHSHPPPPQYPVYQTNANNINMNNW